MNIKLPSAVMAALAFMPTLLSDPIFISSNRLLISDSEQLSFDPSVVSVYDHQEDSNHNQVGAWVQTLASAASAESPNDGAIASTQSSSSITSDIEGDHISFTSTGSSLGTGRHFYTAIGQTAALLDSIFTVAAPTPFTIEGDWAYGNMNGQVGFQAQLDGFGLLLSLAGDGDSGHFLYQGVLDPGEHHYAANVSGLFASEGLAGFTVSLDALLSFPQSQPTPGGGVPEGGSTLALSSLAMAALAGLRFSIAKTHRR